MRNIRESLNEVTLISAGQVPKVEDLGEAVLGLDMENAILYGSDRTRIVELTGGGGGTSNYNSLSNKPSINGIELSGNKLASDLGLATTADTGELEDIILEQSDKINNIADDLLVVNGRVDDINSLAGEVADRVYDLEQIAGNRSIYRINEMFDFPSEAEFIAELHKGPNDGDRDFIIIRAYDTTGISNPLTITPMRGFGALEASNVVMWQAIKDSSTGEFTTDSHIIEISPETLSTDCKIMVPADCNKVNLFYFIGQNTTGQSYWVDTSGTYHPFELENTPIDNFSTASGVTNIVINGEIIPKSNIVHISFGDSYNSVTELYDGFLRDMSLSFKNVDLYGLRNIATINANCFAQSKGIEKLDMSMFTNVQRLAISGNPFAVNTTGLKMIKMPNSQLVIYNAFYPINDNYTNLSEIYIGNIDWTNTNVAITTNRIGFGGNINNSNCIIYSDTIELGNIFKSKFPELSNWSVQLTP